MVSRITVALAARKKTIQEKEKGFTLIELLVVVIIIGVLAAIAIPIYIGVQESAKDSAVKSDLTNAKIAVTAFYTEESKMPAFTATAATDTTDASIGGTDGEKLTEYGMTLSAETAALALSSATATAENFCIQASRDNAAADGKGWFSITSAGGVKEGKCGA